MEYLHSILVVAGIVLAFCHSADMMKPEEQAAPSVNLYGEGRFDFLLGPFERVRAGHFERSTPSYDGLGLRFRWHFRRDSESATPLENSKLIDLSGDGIIDVCEWTMEGGSLSNFVAFLGDDDMNGDERISSEEFPKLERGSESKTADISDTEE